MDDLEQSRMTNRALNRRCSELEHLLTVSRKTNQSLNRRAQLAEAPFQRQAARAKNWKEFYRKKYEQNTEDYKNLIHNLVLSILINVILGVTFLIWMIFY